MMGAADTKTKEEAARALGALAKMFVAIPEPQRREYVGHVDCIMSVIETTVTPTEKGE